MSLEVRVRFRTKSLRHCKAPDCTQAIIVLRGRALFFRGPASVGHNDQGELVWRVKCPVCGAVQDVPNPLLLLERAVSDKEA